MPTLQDLLDQLTASYDIVTIDQRSQDFPNLYEYDMKYRENNTVFYKRISILITQESPEIAEWFKNNPIPDIPSIGFLQKLNNKITNILTNNTDIKFLNIKLSDQVNKRAILEGYIEITGVIENKEFYIYEDSNEDLQFVVI